MFSFTKTGTCQVIVPFIHKDLFRVEGEEARDALEGLREPVEGVQLKWTFSEPYWCRAEPIQDAKAIAGLRAAVAKVIPFLASVDSTPERYYREEDLLATKDVLYVVTEAPEAYDYGYCYTLCPIKVIDLDGKVKSYRLVAMIDNMRGKSYQIPRYGSGNYPSFVVSKDNAEKFASQESISINDLWDVQIKVRF